MSRRCRPMLSYQHKIMASTWRSNDSMALFSSRRGLQRRHWINILYSSHFWYVARTVGWRRLISVSGSIRHRIIIMTQIGRLLLSDVSHSCNLDGSEAHEVEQFDQTIKRRMDFFTLVPFLFWHTRLKRRKLSICPNCALTMMTSSSIYGCA